MINPKCKREGLVFVLNSLDKNGRKVSFKAIHPSMEH
jgi:hypothetical protein